ncbi:MAG: SPOR domain-containing protein [Pseudohongiellaceae bacterium]
MTQDFAKIRPEPILEARVVQAPPGWSLMLTGIVVGIAVGVFACVMFYLSGKVPPLNQAPAALPTASSQNELPAAADPEDPEITLEFYRELQDYEVEVDAVPVELTRLQAGDTSLESPFLLQSGAFESAESAERARQRQTDMGLSVFVQQQNLSSRTMFLIQSGPYTDSVVLQQAEQTLSSNGVRHFRLKPQ